MSRAREVGEYHLGRQIGSGSFSVVWHGRHRIHGTEVAIKEILMERLNKKLQDNLMSEIFILKRINHPNIIRLHDIIDVSGKLYLVLEYCKGGDLSVYIQRHGRVTHSTAKLFMQQLAAGLKILRDNNLIHRDLKPQNLLLSTNNNRAVLKIADFGFARSLQPKGLAETLCGSPLYMAPEIMQLQKYDAKADLWSVGAILFQLVTGKTPFTGNNQIQLLQNIKKSTELHFPLDIKELNSDSRDLCQKLLRHNPVERLTFEEFFNHSFFLTEADQSLRSPRTVDGGVSDSGNIHGKSHTDGSLSHQGRKSPSHTDGSSSHQGRKSPMKSTHGFCLQTKNYKETTPIIFNMELDPKYQFERQGDVGLEHEYSKDCTMPIDQRLSNIHSRGVDSSESIDQDYVFVSEPQTSPSSSSSASGMKSSHSQCVPERMNPPASLSMNTTSTTCSMSIIGAEFNKIGFIGSLESQSSAPSGTSQGSMDIGDAMEQNNVQRIKSLERCASAVTDLVNKKAETGRELEAFSIQLVVLAIWKQALHICQKQSGSEMQECISSHIETNFLLQVQHAEELAKLIDPGNTEMPDAMETIYQSALAFGRHGAVDELMGDGESAEMFYTKAVELLLFILLEAPSLNLNPPFSLTTSDRYRLGTYIGVLRNRQRPDN